MVVPLLIAAFVGYLLGSLPFGYLVARAKGVNIFEVGSKSSGATNVRRVLGNGLGALVLFLDALKGALAVGIWCVSFPLVAYDIHRTQLEFGSPPIEVGICALLAATIGHSFSCFTRFRGGKSVATAAGGFLVLFPIGALIAAATWGVTLAITRYVSLASMLAAVALTIAAWRLAVSPLLFITCATVSAFVIIRHRANISRLLGGTENKIGRKPTEAKP